jgi:hypothetical protein
MKTMILTLIMLAASTASADLLWKDAYRFRKVSQDQIQASLEREELRRITLEEQAAEKEEKTEKDLLAELVANQKKQNGEVEQTTVAEKSEPTKLEPGKLIQSLGPMSRAMERIVKTLSVPELERLVEIRGNRNTDI